MTEPRAPIPASHNSATLGCLVFILFNVVFIAASASAVRTPFGGLMRNVLILGNLVIPVVALVKGRGRFAAGWAMGIGVLVVALAGLCFYALGSIK